MTGKPGPHSRKGPSWRPSPGPLSCGVLLIPLSWLWLRSRMFPQSLFHSWESSGKVTGSWGDYSYLAVRKWGLVGSGGSRGRCVWIGRVHLPPKCSVHCVSWLPWCEQPSPPDPSSLPLLPCRLPAMDWGSIDHEPQKSSLSLSSGCWLFSSGMKKVLKTTPLAFYFLPGCWTLSFFLGTQFFLFSLSLFLSFLASLSFIPSRMVSALLTLWGVFLFCPFLTGHIPLHPIKLL